MWMLQLLVAAAGQPFGPYSYTWVRTSTSQNKQGGLEQANKKASLYLTDVDTPATYVRTATEPAITAAISGTLTSELEARLLRF